jgi:NAD(P)-dependent dehydrogenase (short-subunit alcohol dehydrogenase family)
LKGKNILIAGGCQGIGFEIVQNLSREGIQIFIADIQRGKCAKANIDFFY